MSKPAPPSRVNVHRSKRIERAVWQTTLAGLFKFSLCRLLNPPERVNESLRSESTMKFDCTSQCPIMLGRSQLPCSKAMPTK